MKHVMLDIDGTLIQSQAFDEKCLVDAIYSVTDLQIDSNWGAYPYVTDRGILKTFINERGLPYTLQELEQAVKPVFVSNIKEAIENNPVKEIEGAAAFVNHLLDSPEYIVSVATGGWGESALLKLQSAGFDTERLVLASSNDHYSRTEIMSVAQSKADASLRLPITYFGDAAWDVKACDELNVNLVIVGSKVSHHQQISSFSPLQRALSFIK
ncbi:HAD family hydrolase [Vibrio sonorensis]|uniref:HAD family hydrolase n=1 Tax=Vibrio sonorensis TaxID=1004316 RepID=UPI0008D98777|nr:HAD family hydrolase [Vibrio sonorensis]